jgi:hypothetical protein
MRISGFRCDTCSKEHLTGIDHARSAYIGDCLPSEWFIVQLREKIPEEPLLFCSAKCLLHYAQKISEVEPCQE